VQFKVTDTPKTTTGKTCTFESVAAQTAHPYSALTFTPTAGMTVNDIKVLTAHFAYTTGESHGGSLRWSIHTPAGTIFAYYGTGPNWTGPSLTGQGGSGDNLLDMGDNRFDTSQVGGTFYDTWANVLTTHSGDPVTSVSLVVDSSWQDSGVPGAGDQVLNLQDAAVNDNVSYDPIGWISTPTVTDGTPVQTNAPPATLKLDRVGTGGVLGPIDENSLTSAQGDSGGHFRQVNGNYIYNLDTAALGAGKYAAHILIGGTVVETPGVFGLK